MFKPMLGGMVGVLFSFAPVIVQAQVRQPGPPVLAQTFTPRGSDTAVSPLEIQQFAQALKQLRRVEVETQEKMAKVLKEENLSPERFQEIGQRRSNPDFPVSTEITPREEERFDKALAKIQTIQAEAAPKQRRAITLQGLTLERFNQIGRAVSQSPALKQQVQRSF